jgi:hypothetical protein
VPLPAAEKEPETGRAQRGREEDEPEFKAAESEEQSRPTSAHGAGRTFVTVRSTGSTSSVSPFTAITRTRAPGGTSEFE